MAQESSETRPSAPMDAQPPNQVSQGPAEPSASTPADEGKQQYRDGGTRGNKRKWQQKKGSDKSGQRNKRKDIGRGEYFREQPDKRQRNDEAQAKRQRLEAEGKADDPVYAVKFSKDEIDEEERRPKRKVAVMMGYSGSGYKGMQVMPDQKTIEGDLFAAFVKAGAISKANANDPKKSGLVRCARTDKGVHAAGNVISLKLIIEDENVVEKINSHLSSQIRVWGIERTTGSFSAYQAVDSRWYEYLIPTYSFLPPHPKSFMGKKLAELADEVGDREGYESRQEEVANYWSEVDEKYIKPALEQMKPWVRELVEKALWESDTDPEAPNEKTNEAAAEDAADMGQPVKIAGEKSTAVNPNEKTEEAAIVINGQGVKEAAEPAQDSTESMDVDVAHEAVERYKDEVQVADDKPNPSAEDDLPPVDPNRLTLAQKRAIESAVKKVKSLYMEAKKAYRIPEKRLERLRAALEAYTGTRNYHNYTVRKSFKDASAKRHIKSFKTAEKPIIIANTEWISLKVHGQSFMMHQIRKMVGMAALVVRCGCPVDRIHESLGNVEVAIPKVPGLGLLLERPVFDSYNDKAAEKFGREKIDFSKWEKEIQEFKQREIYDRIFREEEESNQFNAFFAHIDGYREPFFLYLSSKGVAATQGPEADAARAKTRNKPVEYNGESGESDAEGGEG
ncbi:pseudouridine synthase [Phyllosticta citrichinensis]|uniref:Pseudouridine synthase n=1 Tax=Phyllosticta citrichinensis TaxID=1130410 RepID=A0ABR1XJ50_9PEZI